MNERHKRSTTHGLFSPWRLRETLKNVERYDSRLGLARTVVRRVKWGVRVAKQVRLIDSRVGDERQPSTRSHRSRRLRRSTDLLREITRHCTPRQRCIPWLCNTVKSRLRPTIFSFLFNPYWAANQSFFIPLLFFFRRRNKKTSLFFSLFTSNQRSLYSFPFFLLLPHWRRRGFSFLFFLLGVKTFYTFFVKNLFSAFKKSFLPLSFSLLKSLL